MTRARLDGPRADPASAAAARQRLWAALDGQPPPCSGSDVAADFLSERPADAAAAERFCVDRCPAAARVACGALADVIKADAGTWGGKSRGRPFELKGNAVQVISSAVQCPECSGPRLVRHPAGPCVFRHTPGCAIGAAQDSTQHADHARLREAGRGGAGRFIRATTPAESILLAAAGVSAPPGVCTVRVGPGSLVARTWRGVAEVAGATP